MLTLDHKKIHDYIVKKDALVSEGQKNEQKIEKLEKSIKIYEDKERAITSKVDVKELEAKGNALNDECQKKFEELQKTIKEIENLRLAAIPKNIKDAHLALMKECEELERERNKIFLKVQKVKDLVTPLIKKEVKPLLKEYDDIETAKTRDGLVKISTFNHLDEFKAKFRK